MIASDKKILKELSSKSLEELESIANEGRAIYSDAYISHAKKMFEDKTSEKDLPVIRAKNSTRSLVMIRLAIIAVITHSILLVSISLLTESDVAKNTGFLISNLIFSILYYKGKDWARVILAIKYLLTCVYAFGFYLNNASINLVPLGAGEILASIAIVILLSSNTLNKMQKIAFGVFCTSLLLITLPLTYFYNQKSNEIDAIKAIISPQKVVAETFKIELPSKDWKFLTKSNAKSIMGDYVKDIDVAIVNSKATIFANVFDESLEGIVINEANLKIMLEYIKKSLLPENATNIKSSITDRLIKVECNAKIDGVEYFYFFSWKPLEKIAINALFWGYKNEASHIKKSADVFLDRIQEIGPKETMEKVSPKDLYNSNKDASVLIKVYDKKSKFIQFGSGFNMHKNGIIVTNYHVIEGGYYVKVKFPNSGTYEDVYIVAIDIENDLAVFKVQGKNLPYIENMNTVNTEVGDRVYVVSNPEGLVNTLSEGLISNVYESGYYQISAPISEGSSGGAVFNEYGQLIGVASAYIKGGQNLNFAVAIETLSNIEPLKNMVSLGELKTAIDKLRLKKASKTK